MGFGKKLLGRELGFADTAIPLLLALVVLIIDSFVAHEGLAILFNFFMLIGGFYLAFRIFKSKNLWDWRPAYLGLLSIAMILFAFANMVGLVTDAIKTDTVRVLAVSLVVIVMVPNFLALIDILNLEKKEKFLTKKEVKPNESTKKVFDSTDGANRTVYS